MLGVAPVSKLLETICQGVDVARIWRRAERIWRSDRGMTTPAWRRTARYVADELAASGAREVEICLCPADGESVIYGQRAWLEWTVREARLATLPGREVLCDYRAQPRSLMTHSAPTPRDGLDTEVVRVDDGSHEEDYRGLDVTGKIVFTRQHGAEVARAAAHAGAVGVLSDFLVSRDSPYLSPWLPKLALPELAPDPPNWCQQLQWMQLPDGCGLFGFALSPEAGERLRRRLARGRVRVHSLVQSRLSRGTCPAVTGLLPGTGDEQVLVLSHLFEQGANDNASGCAVSLEVAACLSALIAEGKLPRPRRSIRIFQGQEWQGMLAYLHTRPEQLSRTRAALCLDCLGQEEAVAQVPLSIYQNPADRPAFTDPLITWIAEQWLTTRDAAFHWMAQPYAPGSDNIIADAPFGIPCPFVGGALRQWHTTADTMETVSRRTLTHAAVIAAVYCYFIAAAGPEEARFLVELCEHYGRRQIVAEAARVSQEGAGAETARQTLFQSLARLETVTPLVDEEARESLREAIAAATRRLRRLARTLLRE